MPPGRCDRSLPIVFAASSAGRGRRFYARDVHCKRVRNAKAIDALVVRSTSLGVVHTGGNSTVHLRRQMVSGCADGVTGARADREVFYQPRYSSGIRTKIFMPLDAFSNGASVIGKSRFSRTGNLPTDLSRNLAGAVVCNVAPMDEVHPEIRADQYGASGAVRFSFGSSARLSISAID